MMIIWSSVANHSAMDVGAVSREIIFWEGSVRWWEMH
jgi:hypothetical protein